LMPREKIYTKLTKKKLTAKIKIEYTDPNWKEVDFNSARDFFVLTFKKQVQFLEN
jgi:hypothetical protein